MTEDVYLLLGSNIGDCAMHLQIARELIQSEISPYLLPSGVYETAAWGKTDQPPFLNQAIAIRPELKPVSLLSRLKEFEKRIGRRETAKWGPRLIDIDILFYGSQIVQTPELQLPHPYLPVRRFALLPLSEIAPDLVHPVLQKTVLELLSDCPDHSEVHTYP